MSVRGAGDRWLAGEAVPGVAFARHDPVRITGRAVVGGEVAGVITLLLAVHPEPAYLVTLGNGAGEVRVRQSSLQPAGSEMLDEGREGDA